MQLEISENPLILLDLLYYVSGHKTDSGGTPKLQFRVRFPVGTVEVRYGAFTDVSALYLYKKENNNV